MKPLLFYCLLLTSSICFAQIAPKETNEKGKTTKESETLFTPVEGDYILSNAEEFAQNSKLVRREYWKVGKVSRTLFLELLKIEDRLSGVRTAALRITKRHFYGSFNFIDYVFVLDYNELEDLLIGMKAMQDEAAKEPLETNTYRELYYINQRGLEIGYYWKKGKATRFIKTRKYSDYAFEKLPANNLGKLYMFLKSARDQLKELQ